MLGTTITTQDITNTSGKRPAAPELSPTCNAANHGPASKEVKEIFTPQVIFAAIICLIEDFASVCLNIDGSSKSNNFSKSGSSFSNGFMTGAIAGTIIFMSLA
jgi:hypothetical protein